jgi:hypothetical protein
MIVLRVDDLDAPPEARTLMDDLASALGPDYEVQFTMRESEWLPHAVEHIKVFIHTPLGTGLTITLVNQILNFFLAWAKDQRVKRPEHEVKKLTIYGSNRQPLKVVVVKGNKVEEG